MFCNLKRFSQKSHDSYHHYIYIYIIFTTINIQIQTRSSIVVIISKCNRFGNVIWLMCERTRKCRILIILPTFDTKITSFMMIKRWWSVMVMMVSNGVSVKGGDINFDYFRVLELNEVIWWWWSCVKWQHIFFWAKHDIYIYERIYLNIEN